MLRLGISRTILTDRDSSSPPPWPARGRVEAGPQPPQEACSVLEKVVERHVLLGTVGPQVSSGSRVGPGGRFFRQRCQSVTDWAHITEPAATSGSVAVPRTEARRAPGAPYDSVRMYLREIGKVPLLTAPQEVDLAMRIEGGQLAADLLAVTSPDGPLDRARFLRVLEIVDRVRTYQLDPA